MDKIYSRPRFLLFKYKISISDSKNNDYNKNIKKIIKILIVLIIAIITMFKMLSSINEIVDKECEAQAKSIATKVSNEQASKALVKYKYDDLFNVIKDTNGKISMISANTITINEIVSDISIKIQEELNKEDNTSFNLKLGSLTGTRLLAARGPNINIKIATTGSIDTELKSEFEQKGINQTIHKMYLEIKCNVTVLTPYKTMEQKITNQVLLGEAIIIGTTPETYFNFK